MNEISIKLQNVSKKFRIYHQRNDTVFSQIMNFGRDKYEEFQVLKDISLEVKKGEMIGIIGRNGSGKTTLLRIISKIMLPDSGSVYVNGSLTPILQLGTGFNNELSAKDNIILSGLFMGFSKKDIKNKIETIIRFAEIEKFADTKLKFFSSGMYMRLAFAIAIQAQPDILLIDEVLSVGDVFFQKKGLDVINDFRRKEKTIILVSHDLRTISSFCDRALLLEHGKIEKIGDPKDVIDVYLASEKITHKDSFPAANDVLLQIWKERRDLQNAFPEASELNLENLKKWATMHGWNEDPRLSQCIPQGQTPAYAISAPWGINDIGEKKLKAIMDAIPHSDILLRLVNTSRKYFGWYTKHIQRAYEYPWILTEIGNPNGKNILEVGAGVSPLPIDLAEDGAKLVTVDNSKYIRRYNENPNIWSEWGFLDYGLLNDNIESIHEDILFVDFARESFDYIYAVGVIERMISSERKQLWKSINKWLRKNGRLLLTMGLVKDMEKLWNRSEGVIVEPIDQHGDLEELKSEIMQAGFKLIKCEFHKGIEDFISDIVFLSFTKD